MIHRLFIRRFGKSLGIKNKKTERYRTNRAKPTIERQKRGLQQGTMDAVHNNIPASELFKLDEVIDWMTLTWDMYGTNYWVANGDFTASLSDAQREIIYTAAEEAAQYIRDEYRKSTDAWVQKCRDNPDIEVIDIDDEMKQQMLEVSYSIWEMYRDKFDPVAMERIFEEFYPA